MKPVSNAEFAQEVMRLAGSQEAFEPTTSYDPDGDCIEFLASAEPFYAERVDDLVTVYYGQESKEIVGSLIKGVARFCRRLLEQLPGFAITIQDGRVSLEHIFLARLWSSPPSTSELVRITYRKLAQVAEQARAEAELSEALA
jgi:hypothetical protein